MQGVIFSCERMVPGSYRSGREINYGGYEHCVIKKILSILGGELKVDQFETGYVLYYSFPTRELMAVRLRPSRWGFSVDWGAWCGILHALEAVLGVSARLTLVVTGLYWWY
jgi:hypothetical protein